MNLFKVINPTNDRKVYFTRKVDAKTFRNRFEKLTVVSRGPDHWRGESYNRNLNPTPSSKGAAW